MPTHTFVYASRYGGKLDISLDLHLPSSSSSQQQQGPLPVLLWFHGGGLIQGSRNKMPPHIQRAVDSHRIAVVSPDYRLAPQCRAPHIIDEDLPDLLDFVFHQLPSRLATADPDAPALDLDRFVLSGSSAGGWLALLLGLGMCKGSKPDLLARIRGIACIYPITTMDHPFFLEKRTPFLGPLANPPSDYADFVNPDAEVTANTFGNKQRGSFYMHAQREGIFPSLLFTDAQRKDEGWLQKSDVPRFVAASSSAAARSGWPPVFAIHGALDTAVAVDQARKLKTTCDQVGHPCTYDEVADKDHMWDEFEPEEPLAPFWAFVTDKLGVATSSARI